MAGGLKTDVSKLACGGERIIPGGTLIGIADMMAFLCLFDKGVSREECGEKGGVLGTH